MGKLAEGLEVQVWCQQRLVGISRNRTLQSYHLPPSVALAVTSVIKELSFWGTRTVLVSSWLGSHLDGGLAEPTHGPDWDGLGQRVCCDLSPRVLGTDPTEPRWPGRNRCSRGDRVEASGRPPEWLAPAGWRALGNILLLAQVKDGARVRQVRSPGCQIQGGCANKTQQDPLGPSHMQKPFYASCFLFVGKRLRPPRASLSSKGQIQLLLRGVRGYRNKGKAVQKQ